MFSFPFLILCNDLDCKVQLFITVPQLNQSDLYFVKWNRTHLYTAFHWKQTVPWWPLLTQVRWMYKDHVAFNMCLKDIPLWWLQNGRQSLWQINCAYFSSEFSVLWCIPELECVLTYDLKHLSKDLGGWINLRSALFPKAGYSFFFFFFYCHCFQPQNVPKPMSKLPDL